MDQRGERRHALAGAHPLARLYEPRGMGVTIFPGAWKEASGPTAL